MRFGFLLAHDETQQMQDRSSSKLKVFLGLMYTTESTWDGAKDRHGAVQEVKHMTNTPSLADKQASLTDLGQLLGLDVKDFCRQELAFKLNVSRVSLRIVKCQ